MRKAHNLGKLWSQKGRIVFYKGKDYKLGYVGITNVNDLWGAEIYPLFKVPVLEFVSDFEEIILPPKNFLRLAREKEIK